MAQRYVHQETILFILQRTSESCVRGWRPKGITRSARSVTLRT